MSAADDLVLKALEEGGDPALVDDALRGLALTDPAGVERALALWRVEALLRGLRPDLPATAAVMERLRERAAQRMSDRVLGAITASGHRWGAVRPAASRLPWRGLMAAGLAGLALAGWWAWSFRLTELRILAVSPGTVVQRQDATIAVQAGYTLMPGDRVDAPVAGTAIGLTDGSRFDCAGGTQVLVGDGTDGWHLDLQKGALHAAVSRQPAGRPLIIDTPRSRATVVGTRFTLTAEADSTRVAVDQGLVDLVERTTGERALVGMGQVRRQGGLQPTLPTIAWDRLPSPLLRGDDNSAWRDPAVFIHEGVFRLYCTMALREPDGRHVSRIAELCSRDLVTWSQPRFLTPVDRQLQFSQPGNVVKVGDEWILGLNSYPRPDATSCAKDDARLWCIRSPDLVTWSAPEPMAVHGPDRGQPQRAVYPFLVQDPADAGRWLCFYKDNHRGVGMSTTRDFRAWTYEGVVMPGAQNPCVVRDGDGWVMTVSLNRKDNDGQDIFRSDDLRSWRPVGSFRPSAQQWPWASGHIYHGRLVDGRQDPRIGRWLMVVSGNDQRKGGPPVDRRGHIGVAWSNDLVSWTLGSTTP